MINPNANNPLQPVDSFWSVDFIKTIVEHPGYIPSHVFANVNFESPENDFTIKFLQDIYNPPDGNLHLYRTKVQELHNMRLKNRYQPTTLAREAPKKPELQWNNNTNQQEGPMIGILNRNYNNVPTKPIPRGYPGMNPFVPIMAKNRPTTLYNRPDLVPYPKRRMDMNMMFDMSKKSLRNPRNAYPKNVPKGPKFIDLVDEDGDPSLPEKKTKRDNINKPMKYKHLGRTGLNKNKTNTNPIEILDSPDPEEPNIMILPVNCDEAHSEEPPQFEEEKAELTTSTLNLPAMEEQNEQEGDITNENSKAETFEDAFDFNIDDLGIKILGEVFQCSKCQKQISQRDVDRGFKETCPPCSKAISKASKKTQQAAQVEQPAKSKQTQATATSSSQQSKEKPKEIKEIKEPVSEPAREIEKYWVLAPLHQSRSFYEEGSLDILDPQQRQKNTPIGRNNQIGYMPLTLYNTSSGRKTRKLWKPDRLDFSTYEKFKDEVNARNGIHLIDEEVTEILVRHKYDIESALQWSIKTNPDFQYYLKRSATRKRLITRGTGKNY